MPYYILWRSSTESGRASLSNESVQSSMGMFPPPHPMFRRILLSVAAFVASQALFTLSVHAASFPDVPRDHPFGASIALLAEMKIITGAPDGNFYPARPVNRAEFLMLLYRAKGWTATAPSAACFSDVGRGSWYEAVVCEASAKGHVGGYPDGKFRPEKEVNRVEALKMIFKIFGYRSDVDSEKASTYLDVQYSAWYMPYFKAAFAYNILPVAGQGTTYYYPESSLLRGEAAAYIHNAMNATLQSSSASSAQSSSAATRSSASSVSSVSDLTIHEFDFPFGDEGTFVKKQKVLYRFTLAASKSVELRTTVDEGVSCTLFKLNEAGLSFEYYFGFETETECVVNAALSSGNYQLELSPKKAGTAFKIHTSERKSAGNDGFSEAKALVKNQPRSMVMDVGDTSDWYTFSLSQETKLTVKLSEGDGRCLIYPMENVSLFSFSGPVCNEEYAFPRGTYYVGVIRKNLKQEKFSYTLGY